MFLGRKINRQVNQAVNTFIPSTSLYIATTDFICFNLLEVSEPATWRYFHKAFGTLPVPLPISRDNDKFRAGPQCHAYWLGCFYSEFLGRKGSRCHDTSAIGRVSGYNRRDEPDIRPALRQYLNCRPTQKSRVDIYVENYPFERHKTICTRPSS